MPKYAIVVIVEAPRSEIAWEAVRKQLLLGDAMDGSISYVGAPWLVPGNRHGPVNFETDCIRLRIDSECVNLDPADS